MKRRVVTIIILLTALVCYAAGYSGAGNVAIFVGALFELWFWIRLFGKQPSD